MAECKTMTKPELKYCSLHTEKHPILCRYKNVSDCFIPLSDLLVNEGYKKKCSCKEKVYSLDKIEAKLAKQDKRNKTPTVDCCFVTTEEGKAPKVIFVECKLNISNYRNGPQECKDIKGKILGAKFICTCEYQIIDKCYTLFTDEVTNRLRRLQGAGQIPKYVEIMTAPMLYKYFFLNKP